MCDRVNVMYAGRIVETGSVDELFENPRMPYAWGLLDSLPRIDDVRGDRLRTIEGLPPLLIDPPDRLPLQPALPLHPRHLPHAGAGADRPATARATWPAAGRPSPEAGSHDRDAPYPPTSARRARPHDKANIVEVDDLKVHFPIRGGHLPVREGRGQGGRRRDLRGPPRRDARPGRRVRLRQEHDRPRDDPAARSRPRAASGSTARISSLRSTKELRRMRRRMQIIFQDPYGSLDPRMTVVGDHRRADRDAQPRVRGCEARADRRAAPAGRSRPDVRQPLPARVLGRPAPAHRGRPGARRRAGVHRLRRTDLRPRRVDPGAGPQPADGPRSGGSG